MGELAECINSEGKLDEAVARNVFKQVVAGLKSMHDKKVLHRDLKCENVLVCGEELTKDTPVKLIDFGAGAHLRQDDDLPEGHGEDDARAVHLQVASRGVP